MSKISIDQRKLNVDVGVGLCFIGAIVSCTGMFTTEIEDPDKTLLIIGATIFILAITWTIPNAIKFVIERNGLLKP